ncbi:MAG: hypothetical protein ACKVX7_02805 [Planctomycetota bacterium]
MRCWLLVLALGCTASGTHEPHTQGASVPTTATQDWSEVFFVRGIGLRFELEQPGEQLILPGKEHNFLRFGRRELQMLGKGFRVNGQYIEFKPGAQVFVHRPASGALYELETDALRIVLVEAEGLYVLREVVNGRTQRWFVGVASVTREGESKVRYESPLASQRGDVAGDSDRAASGERTMRTKTLTLPTTIRLNRRGELHELGTTP